MKDGLCNPSPIVRTEGVCTTPVGGVGGCRELRLISDENIELTTPAASVACSGPPPYVEDYAVTGGVVAAAGDLGHPAHGPECVLGHCHGHVDIDIVCVVVVICHINLLEHPFLTSHIDKKPIFFLMHINNIYLKISNNSS